MTTTLKTYFTRWLDRRLGLTLISATTAEGYEFAMKPCLAALGARPLDEISADDIMDFYVARLRVVTPATLRAVHVLLTTLFAAAHEAGTIARNPMKGVEAPRGGSKERHALDAKQIRALLDYSADKPLLLRTVRLALATGLRRGELVGLRGSDLDLDAGTLTVSRGIVKVGKTEREAPPKTEAGARTISLPADLVADLKAARIGAAEPVLKTSWGNRPSLAYMSELVGSALSAIGCGEGYCLHSTRHAHATHLLKAQMPIKAVSKRLGHADVTVTMRTYAKVLAGDDADCAAAMARVMGAT